MVLSGGKSLAFATFALTSYAALFDHQMIDEEAVAAKSRHDYLVKLFDLRPMHIDKDKDIFDEIDQDGNRQKK